MYLYSLGVGLKITESGLPGVLFKILDTETDSQLIKDVHDTLTSMLQMLAADNLSQWLSLCRTVLTVTSGIIFRFRFLNSIKQFSPITWDTYSVQFSTGISVFQ